MLGLHEFLDAMLAWRPSGPSVPIPPTRFTNEAGDPPYLPPPYSSLFDDARTDKAIHERTEKIRQNALHPLYLQAGQQQPVNGAFGRQYTPELLPEILGGAVLRHLI